MVAAIILAAGESRRMGSPKPLLPYRGTTFLGALIEMFQASRARPLVVVLGHEADRVRREVSLGDVIAVENKLYRTGMLSSIRTGLHALAEKDVEGAIVCPVDHPAVDVALIDSMIERFEAVRPAIVLPVHHGRRGHPVLFSSSVFDELMDAPDSVGARQVVWNHAEDVLEVATEQSGVHIDIDTPEEYRKLVG